MQVVLDPLYKDQIAFHQIHQLFRGSVVVAEGTVSSLPFGGLIYQVRVVGAALLVGWSSGLLDVAWRFGPGGCRHGRGLGPAQQLRPICAWRTCTRAPA